MFWNKKQPKNVVNLDIIKRYEGFSAKPYLCPGGVATIGYGSTTYADGTKVTLKDKPISEKKAEELLRAYWEKEIWSKLEDYAIKLTLSDDQIQALSSLIYNIGWGAFSRSTLWKSIKAKDWEGAIKNWNWYYSNKKFLKGLAKRRAEEAYLFFKDL